MNSLRRTLSGTVTTLAVVAACGSAPDTPRPERGDTGGRTTTTSTAEPTPTRLRALDLEGTDPCALLTAEQLRALQIDAAGELVDVDLYRTKGCSWTVIGAGNRLVPVTIEDISAWTDGNRTGRAEEAEPVLGFRAVTVTLPADDDRCDVMVDTAEGQYLAATFSVLPTYEDRFPALCDGARTLAVAAMGNLLK